MSEVDVSVIIPCYRAARTIERALQSVARQTARPREIIVVDDASGDGTVPEIRRVGAKLPIALRVIQEPVNRGVATARNVAWDGAKSEFIAFLDADDSWHPHKLDVQHAFMIQHPQFSLSGHAHAMIGAELSEHARLGTGFEEVTFAQMLWSNRFTTSSAMLRRRIPERFASGKRHMEDHLLWLRVASSGVRVARLHAAASYRYAQPFGESGLSAQLLRMERAELGNYRVLLRERRIGPVLLVVLYMWSLLKFFRRLALVTVRKSLRTAR